MQALSIKQPWAQMIVKSLKTIETRTWKTSYRGKLLIVSSKEKYQDYPCGYALAIADLTDCRKMTEEDEFLAQCKVYEGAYAWILTNIQPLTKAFKVKGRLGLYEVDVR